MVAGRSTANRDRHRRILRDAAQPCHICQQPIDYSLPFLHPMEFVVDHVIALNRGGTDALDNVAAAHRSCNRTKSDKALGELTRTRRERVEPFTTDRAW